MLYSIRYLCRHPPKSASSSPKTRPCFAARSPPCSTSSPDITVVAQASNGHEALNLARQHTPDVVVTDIEMPERTGLELAASLKDSSHQPRVIILTTFARPGYLRRALDRGRPRLPAQGAPRHRARRSYPQGPRRPPRHRPRARRRGLGRRPRPALRPRTPDPAARWRRPHLRGDRRRPPPLRRHRPQLPLRGHSQTRRHQPHRRRPHRPIAGLAVVRPHLLLPTEVSFRPKNRSFIAMRSGETRVCRCLAVRPLCLSFPKGICVCPLSLQVHRHPLAKDIALRFCDGMASAMPLQSLGL